MSRSRKFKLKTAREPSTRLLSSSRPLTALQIALAVMVVAAFGFAVRNRYSSHAANGYPITIEVTTNIGSNVAGFYSTNHTFGTCNNGSAAGGTGATYSSFTAPVACNGNSFGNSTSDPVYLYAPSVYGYTFSSWSWTGGIGGYVDCSRNPCIFAVPSGNSGYGTLTANYTSNTPPPPGVSLTPSSSSIAYGGSTYLNWTSSNNPTSCYGSGGNFGGGHAGSGSQNTGSLTSTTSYSLTCSNAGGSNTASTTVSVGPKPAPAPPPTPAPAPAPTGSSGGSGGSTPKSSGGSSSPGSVGGTAASPAVAAQSPATPTNFSTSTNDSSSIVTLGWTSVAGVNSFSVERSTDNTTWQPLATTPNSTYQDTSALFNIHYYYRLASVDNSGNKSPYALSDITTPQFSGNSSGSSDTTIKSDDGLVVATIPAQALTADASCNIVASTDHNDSLPVTQSVKMLAGPYSIVCQQSNGDIVPTFQKPVTVAVTLSADVTKANGHFKFYHFASSAGKWDIFKPTFAAKQKQYTFATTSAIEFVVAGSKNGGFPWGLIIGILITLGVLAAILFIIAKRGQTGQYQSYLRRKYYDL